jgi:hypothetical protein
MLSPYRCALRLALVGVLLAPDWAAAQVAAPGSDTTPGARAVVDAIAVRGGGSCIDRDELGEHVHAWLEREHIDAELGVVLDLRASADRQAAHLVLRRDDRVLAERTFPRLPSECSRAVAALGLAIALAVDATILDELTAASVAPAPSRFGASATIEGAALAGVLGRPSAGLLLGVELRGRGDVAARLAIGTTTRAQLSVGSGAAEVGLSVGRAELCRGAPWGGEWALRGCAGMAAGVARAEGQGFAQTSTANMAWFAPTAGVALVYHLRPPAALTFGADLMAVLVRPRLQVHDREGGVVAQRSLPSMGAGLSVGAAWEFR